MPSRPRRPIDDLNTEWETICRRPDSKTALECLARCEPEVAELGCGDLGDLVSSLRSDRAVLSRTRAAGIIRAMLRSEDAHPLLARALLQALLPGLVSVARRLSWGRGGEWEDGGAFFADLVATAWEVIVDWSGSDRRYAVLDLLSAVRCRARRQIVLRRSTQEKVLVGWEPRSDDQPTVVGSPPGPTAIDRLAELIDQLTGEELTPADAAVLYGHRVLGLSLSDLARLSDQPRRQLDARYRRAALTLSAAVSI